MTCRARVPDRFRANAGPLLWSKLRCPCCLRRRVDAGELSWDGATARCSGCGREYPVFEGIPVLLDEGSEPETVERHSGDVANAREFYETVFKAEDYSERELEVHEARIRAILGKYLPASPAVLEVGSGRGQLQHLFDRYLALDISLTALSSFIDGPAVCARAEALPVADASFDFIVTIATLEHVLAPDLAFAELERVLAPGGVLYLAPAWHVRAWAAEGLPVRPYTDLSWQQRIRKALLPLLDNIAFRGAIRIPWRLSRRLYWRLVKRGPVSLRWKRLRPNYEKYWMSDSDAACSLDSHEGILYFESRGWQCLSHEAVVARLFARGDAVVIRKPMYVEGCQ